MIFITIIAHVFLYLVAPQMSLDIQNKTETGIFIESSVNTSPIIKGAIVKALPFSFLCCVILSLLCAALLSRVVTTPVMQISQAAVRMSRLDRTAKCQVRTQDEIGLLALNVNNL